MVDELPKHKKRDTLNLLHELHRARPVCPHCGRRVEITGLAHYIFDQIKAHLESGHASVLVVGFGTFVLRAFYKKNGLNFIVKFKVAIPFKRALGKLKGIIDESRIGYEVPRALAQRAAEERDKNRARMAIHYARRAFESSGERIDVEVGRGEADGGDSEADGGEP